MTYDTDPTRWTQTRGAAPELLRDAFEAGHREGPSELQMRSLALKLAALSSGAALAAAAAPAQAASAHAGVAAASSAATTTGGALSFAKVAVSLALLGAATGTVLYRSAETPSVAQHAESSSAIRMRAPIVAPVVLPPSATSRVAASGVKSPAAGVVRERSAQSVEATAHKDPAMAPEVAVEDSRQSSRGNDKPLAEAARTRSARERGRQRSEQRAARTAATSSAVAHVEETREVSNDPAASEGASLSEIDLLRRARANLTSRPREAYRLAELHRREFPKGVFVQERDALAIEALLRAGELKEARGLAEKFIERYPGSPHAHRFRESMEIP